MNLYQTVKNAEICFQNRETEAAINCLERAEAILKQANLEKNPNPPFICCVFIKQGLIHCGKAEERPLFLGTVVQRPELCRKCRESCQKKIKELKKKLGL